MGLLAEAFNPRPRAEGWSVTDDRWYVKDISGFLFESGTTGIPLTADTILNCGTVLAAVRFLGDSWAMCPPSTYRKTARGREEDPGHYSQRVLRNPNAWQTGNRWRHVNGVWMKTWGNSYNEIVSGRISFAEELRPLHPSVTEVVDQRNDGSLLYLHRPPLRPERRLGQERVLHFRDLSTDGTSGLPMYRLIRNVVGIALLAERHQATFLRKGARVSGLLVPTIPLNPEQRKTLRESVNEDLGGSNNTGTIGILPSGVDLKPVASTNREGQFMELSDQVVGSILRFLGVPGVVVGWADKTATYASAEAFFEKGGIKHCVLPLIVNVEAEEEKALLLQDGDRQIKHNLDVLLRANTKDRFDAIFKAVGGPWMSRNEARRIEDLNEDPDPEMDKILTPVNMAPELNGGGSGPLPPAEEPAPPMRRPPPPPDDDEEDGQAALLRQYAHDNATRVVRREVAAIKAKAPKLARDAQGWRAFVLGYYERHIGHVAEVMRIQEKTARVHCDRQAAALLAGGAAAAERFEAEVPPQLAAMALGGELAKAQGEERS